MNLAFNPEKTAILIAGLFVFNVSAQSNHKILTNQQIWNSFSKSEQITLIEKFPQIEIRPSETVGTIQQVQAINRSSRGTNSGTIIGSALGQATYIDRALSGKNNYSAKSHLGAAILGAALGSTLDSPGQLKYIFNYAVKTLDGQLREVQVTSGNEFTRPIGQCVQIPAVEPVDNTLCSTDKSAFLKELNSIDNASTNAPISHESTRIPVNCRVPGVGLMTLENNTCLQMEGTIEK